MNILSRSTLIRILQVYCSGTSLAPCKISRLTARWKFGERFAQAKWSLALYRGSTYSNVNVLSFPQELTTPLRGTPHSASSYFFIDRVSTYASAYVSLGRIGSQSEENISSGTSARPLVPELHRLKNTSDFPSLPSYALLCIWRTRVLQRGQQSSYLLESNAYDPKPLPPHDIQPVHYRTLLSTWKTEKNLYTSKHIDDIKIRKKILWRVKEQYPRYYILQHNILIVTI